MVSWAKYIHGTAESRRIKAIGLGEVPPEIKGASNYERAALREQAHRTMMITTQEKWIGRGFLFGVPAIILTVFFTSAPI